MAIKIFTKEDKKNIYIKIKDSGTGIPKEIGDKIFEPFFTTKPSIKNAKKDEPTGTGIVLDSVSGMLKPYHGQIKYNSEMGKGTEFVIKIPVEINQDK